MIDTNKITGLITELAATHQRINKLEVLEAKQKRIISELEDSELRYRRLFETAQDGILILNKATGQIIDINPFLTDMLGYSRKDFLGKHLWEVGPIKNTEASKVAFQELLEKEYIRYEHLPLETRDKRLISVEFVSNIYTIDHSKVIQCNIRDITDRKRLEAKLTQYREHLNQLVEQRTTELKTVNKRLKTLLAEHKKTEKALTMSEDKYRLLVENANEAIVVAQDGMLKFANLKTTELSGYSREELISMPFAKLVHPDDRKMVTERHLKRLKGEELPRNYPFRVIDKNGLIRWVEISVVFITWEGRPATLNLLTDITERKQAEDELRESEERYRELADLLPLTIYETDTNGNFTYTNRMGYETFGYNMKDLKKGMNIIQVIASHDREKAQIAFSQRIKGYKSLSNEYTAMKKDGSVFPIIIYSSPIVKDKEVTGTRGAIIDISQRKTMEEQIIKSKNLLQTVIDSTPDYIAVKDAQHRYLFVNKSLADSLNSRPQDVIGKEDTEFYPAEQLFGNPKTGTLSMRADDNAAIRGELVHAVSRMVNKEGTAQIFDAYRVPLKDTSGNIYGVLAYSRDITELQKSNEELKNSYQLLTKALRETVDAIATICETRDPYTAGHQVRVTSLACAIVSELGLSEKIIENIRIGGMLHDIGKMYIPGEILSKPGKLTETEFMLIKNHPQVGYDIIKKIDFPSSVAQMALQHHERQNGSGYPKGLRNEDIIIEAKILAVADVVEAMSSHRPYRPALGTEKALEEISKNKGILYDEKAVDACVRLFQEKGFKFDKKL